MINMMNMKNIQKLMFLIMFLTLFPLLVNAQATLSSANGALSLSNVGISNKPIIAGHNITMTFQLFNSYSYELTNVNLYLQSQNPIINISPSSSYLINAIGEGLYGGSNFDHFIYKFHIPSMLQPGKYVINVIATYETTQNNGINKIVGTSQIPIVFYVYGIPKINISSSLINLKPNQQNKISLNVINSGTDIARNVTLKLLNSSIFKIIGSNEYAIGTINQQQIIPVKFIVQTNNNITNSTYFLNVQVNYVTRYNTNASKILKIPLNLVINNPNIVASILSASPSQVFSGSNQTLLVNFQNIGLGEAKNISIKFLSNNSITIGNPNKFFIAQLFSNTNNQQLSQKTESIFVQINNQSLSYYQIPVIINYTTLNYKTKISKKFLINVSLEKKAVFSILSINDSIQPGQSYAKIILKIKNTGNAKANNINFALQSIYPISPVNPNQYISSLSPDQIKNITFYVSVDADGNSGNYPITIYEQWTQQNTPQNQQLSSSTNYYVVVKQKAKTNNKYLIKPVEYIAMLITILVIIVFVIKKYKQKKQYIKQDLIKNKQQITNKNNISKKAK